MSAYLTQQPKWFFSKSIVKTTFSVIATWFLYSVAYMYFKSDAQTTVSGIFSLVGESGLDFVIAALALMSWRGMAKGSLRNFFFLLFVAFAISFLSDGVYNYLLNIKQVSLTPFVDTLFDIPFAIFLFFMMTAWAYLFSMSEKGKKYKALHYAPYFLSAAVIFSAFMFGIHWKINYFSTIGSYQVIDTVFEAIGFLFASFCLIRAKESWVRFLAVGYLLVMLADILIRYTVVVSSVQIVNPFECLWILGLAFVATSFFLLKKQKGKMSSQF